MRFGCLGSGSRGNGLVIEARDGAHVSCILLDCGFGEKETAARLARLDLEPADIDAVLVTHEHSDHTGGVFKFAARHAIRVFLTYGTLSATPKGRGALPAIEVIDSHAPFSIGAIEAHPFPVPHDAREPVQYVFSDGVRRIGVLTDTGHPTPHLERMLSGVHALLLECNHDLGLLAAGDYPAALKRRIAGPYGHLDNATAARLLLGLDRSHLQHLVAAHLSQQNNTPALARSALSAAVGCAEAWVAVADQEAGLEWREVS